MHVRDKDNNVMNELMSVGVYLLGILQGVVIGYIMWASNTPFKQGLTDGLSLKFLWGRK
jgi:hypothetical protein